MAAEGGASTVSERTISDNLLAQDSTLSADTLRMAYDCALLSKLAYYNPTVVEELRQRANHENATELELTPEVTKTTKSGITVSGTFKDTQDKRALEKDKNVTEYLRVLEQFKAKTDIHYFDAQTMVQAGSVKPGRDTKQSSQAYLFFSEMPSTETNVLYVAFRGTETSGESRGDIKADLGFKLVPAKPELIQKDSWGPGFTGPQPMQLHRGFLDQFEALATAIDCNAKAAVNRIILRDQLDELKKQSAANGGIKVIVTGHSLGGALATIGSFVAAAKHPDLKISCYNFGSPRVGNKAFTDYYEVVMTKSPNPGEVYRFVNKDDPVPHVPTPPGYHHVPVGGYKLEAKKDRTVEAKALLAEHWISFDVRQWFALVREAVAWFNRHLCGLSFAENHDMNLYAAHIKRLKKKAEALGMTASI